MVLKKINGLFSWFLIMALLGHLGTMSYSMLTGWYDYNLCKALAHITAGITIAHIVISMVILFFFSDGSDFKNYRNHNRKLILQRASGLIIIALLHLHIQAFNFIVTGAALSSGLKFETLFTEYLFFAAIMTHLAVSFSRSLIGVGLIRSECAEKNADRTAYAACLLLFVLASFALTSFILSWTGIAG